MKRFQTLSDDEIGKVLATIKKYPTRTRSTTMWSALFTLLANLGLRITEAVELTWDSVDFERGEITVKTLKQKDTKGRPVLDTLPLDEKTIAALLAWKQEAEPGDRIFPISRKWAYNVFQRLLHYASIRPIKMHCLRHSAVTRWLEQTGDLAFAQFMARHRSVTSTAVYVHATKVAEKFRAIQPLGAEVKCLPRPSRRNSSLSRSAKPQTGISPSPGIHSRRRFSVFG